MKAKLLLFVLLAAAAVLAQPQSYDLVILHGRVMDPATNTDKVANVGINQGKIAIITGQPLTGARTIDAAGLVVAPGFIDLHSHGQDAENYRFKAMDGVTTALELEVGVGDVDAWYAARQGKALINYGATVGHIPARDAVMHDSSTFLPHDHAMNDVASPQQIAAMQEILERGLKAGALGVGFGVAYTPAASHEEILEMFRVAARHHATAFVHVRFGGAKEPDSGLAAVQEVIADSAISGAPLHVVHISSSGLRSTGDLLHAIGDAQKRGLDVTTECYPYTAAMTDLASAIFNPGWQEIQGISYHDLQWAATGERLTEQTFNQYRKQGGMVVIHEIPPDIALLAVSSPLTMIASDGMITNGKGHPRGAGTYARVLGYYVRQQHALTLMDALRKMTIMPAERLAPRAAMMKERGRIGVGAVADLTVFDPERVIDKATFDNPAQYSEGMRYVLVGGTPVVSQGRFVDGAAPGAGIRAPRE
ncbi:MAG TPA: amidohydrolase family protein [Terriglobales bacterium]|nr:amidohydrolase family protein [Terriglobales bacterium]